mgnify:CR=1 FL=1
MTTEIEFGLKIMAIGMITVFSILGMVVIGGKLMILSINKWGSEEAPDLPLKSNDSGIDKTKISVLSSVVAIVTGGKGKITNIKKL